MNITGLQKETHHERFRDLRYSRIRQRCHRRRFKPTEAEYLVRQASHALKTNLVTKDDLHTEIVTAKFDFLKWIIMALIARAGLIVALVKLL